MLIGKRGFVVLSWADFDDLLDRFLHSLRLRLALGDVALVVNLDTDGVLDLAGLALLNNLGFTRLQFRVDADLNTERSLLSPLDLRGGGLALGADLDDLLDRLGHTLGLGLGVHNLRVLDGLGCGDLVLTGLAFLNSFLRAGFHRVVELEFSFERHFDLVFGSFGACGLGTNADNPLGRFLGALSRDFRVTRRLAVHDLLSRGHYLGTKLTLLVDDLLTLFKRVIKDDLGLERNRLLNLGHHSGVLSSRTVLNDLVDRILGLLLLRGDSCLVTLSGEVSRVGLLTRHALLDDLDLTRLQIRVRTSLNLKRNLSSPRHLLRSLRRLRTDLDHLINRLLGDLLGDLRVTRLGVGDVALDRHRLLTRNTLGHNLGRTSRHVRIELNLHTERNLRLNRLSGGASGLGADTDDLLGRFLGALRGHDRVARRLAVDELLSRGLNLGTDFTLLVNNLLAGFEGVIEDHLRLERNRLLGLGHELARSNARAVLDDPLDRLLGGLFLDDLSLITRSGELSGEGLLTVLTFLNNPGFTRLQVRVLANLGRVRDWNLPGDFLGALSRLGADDDDLILRLFGALPSTVLLHLLLARLALGLNLVLAGRDGIVVLVLDLERNLALRDSKDVDHSVSGIRRAVLVGHSNRDLDLIAWLCIRRCGCGDLAVVVNADIPAGRNITQLVWVFLRDIHGVRLVQCNWQRCGFTRVHGLHRVGRLSFPVVGQLDHGGDWHQRGGALRSGHSDVDGLLVARLGVCWRGGRYDTGVRVDGVLPAVNFLLKDRLIILILAEGELGALWSVLYLVVHSLVWTSRLHRVGRGVIALQNDDGALDFLRLVSVVVVGENRDVQDVALRSGARNRRGDFTRVLVNLDGPRAAVIRVGVLGLTVREGVALRGLVGRVTAQATLRYLRLEGDLRSRLISHRVVGRDLDVHDRLELDLDLVRGLVRVGCLDLRGDDRARCDGVVRLRGDLAGVIDRDGPASRDGGLIDLELGRVNRLVALHNRLGSHLGGKVVTDVALGQAWAYEVGDLGVVRVNNHEEFQLVSGTVGILHRNHRAREGAWTRVLWSGDGDVVVLVHLDGPALVDVFLVQGDLGVETAVSLLLRQLLDQVRGLGEGDLLRLGSQRAGRAVNAGDNRGVRLVVLRGVVLGVVQGERLRVDDVRLVVAGQRVGVVEDLGVAKLIVVLTSGLELIHGTRLRQNGEVHVLISCQVGTAVLRPGEVDVTVVRDTQVLGTAGYCRVGGADERAVAVVGLHDHAGHGVIRAAVLNSRNVNLTDLGFRTCNDDVLLKVLPRNRDRVTFDVLARPRVHDGRKGCTVSLGGIRRGGTVSLIVSLPGVTDWVRGSGLSELLDFRIGQFRVDVQVSLSLRSSNIEFFVGLVRDFLAAKSLASIRGRNLSRIEERAHKA